MSRLSSLLVFVAAVLAAATVTAPARAAGDGRTITIHNQCDVDYFMLPIAGAAPYQPATLTACGSDADCIAGSACDLTTKLCFWRVPTPATGQFRIPSKASNSLTFPYVENSNDIHWSGNIGFCQPGTCGPVSEQQCDAQGCGVFAGPNNVAEFTFAKTGSDFYDVSNIAGVNVPMQFAPVLTTASWSADAPYACGTPGAVSLPNGQWQSSWHFEAPSVYHQWVASGGAACQSNSDCANGDLCGLTNNIGANPQFKLTCGKPFGYWSANAVCAQQSTFGAPFNCEQPLDGGNAGLKLDNLIRCDAGIGSCYQPGPSTACCGCADWSDVLGPTVVPASTAHCNAKNPNWVSAVQPELAWLKRGCPSCYTYPYDDMSSTYICAQKQNGHNHIDYAITLCPHGSEALVSAADNVSKEAEQPLDAGAQNARKHNQ